MTPDEIMQTSRHQEIILVEAHNPVKAKKLHWFKNKFYKAISNGKYRYPL